MNRRIGVAALAAYVATVFAANYFIGHVGSQPFPGGPHTIPVGFGYRAPSGVLWVGLAFTLRDVVQASLGRLPVAPSLAWASGCAFLLSESLDFAVYTPLAARHWLAAVAASNIAGLAVDTFLFLWLAFHSITFWQGQVIGKAWMTALAVAVLAPARRSAQRRTAAA